MFCAHCHIKIRPREEDNLVADDVFCGPCYEEFWTMYEAACDKLDRLGWEEQ